MFNNSRIEKEKKTVKLMIEIYCKKKDGNTCLLYRNFTIFHEFIIINIHRNVSAN